MPKKRLPVSRQSLLLITAAAAVHGILILLRRMDGIGWEKLIDWEVNIFEYAAGIFVGITTGALLIGHAVIVDRHQNLGVPLQTHNGELAQSHIDSAAVISSGKLPIKEAVDKGRHLTKVAITVVASAAVLELSIQDNWVHSLYC